MMINNILIVSILVFFIVELLLMCLLVHTLKECNKILKETNTIALLNKRFIKEDYGIGIICDYRNPVMSMEELIEIEDFAKACYEKQSNKKNKN